MHSDAERISSYLDGELAPAERAEVEKLLVEDPAARELFAELRQLQSGVRELPQYKLPPKFADEVMRAAERLMLLGPGDTELSPAAREAAEWTAPAPRAAVRNLWSSPAWFVSGAAAAVLLMFAVGYLRKGGEPRPVNPGAIATTSAEPDATPPIATEGPATPPRVAETSPPAAETATPEQEVASEGTAPSEAPRVVEREAPRSPTPRDGGPLAETKNPAPAVAVRQRPPYGWVVWVDVERKAIKEGHFDRLIAESGVAISNAIDQAAIDQGLQDVIYAEATPEELNAVFLAMLDHPAVYRSPIMQHSLGVFRDPALWSEILDAVNPIVDGSRAVHLTPEVAPARPLALDQANADTVKHLEENVPAEDYSEPVDDAPRKPVVDDGLVRAVFILRPISAADGEAAPPLDDSPAPKP